MTKSLDGFLGFLTLGHCTASNGCSKHTQRGNIWGKMFGASDGEGSMISSTIEIVVIGGIALVALYGVYFIISDIVFPIIF